MNSNTWHLPSARYSLWWNPSNNSKKPQLLALSNDFNDLRNNMILKVDTYDYLIKDRETPYTASEAQLAEDLGCSHMVEYGHVVYRSKPSQNTPTP